MTPDPRYPYTYAADYLRDAVESRDFGRAEASMVMRVIASALGHKDHSQIANALAGLYKKEYESTNQ